MSSMTKDEINTSLFDEVKRQRDEIERLTAENMRLEDHKEHCFDRMRTMTARNAALEAALNDIADGNRDDCGDCRYNMMVAKEALAK